MLTARLSTLRAAAWRRTLCSAAASPRVSTHSVAPRSRSSVKNAVSAALRVSPPQKYSSMSFVPASLAAIRSQIECWICRAEGVGIPTHSAERKMVGARIGELAAATSRVAHGALTSSTAPCVHIFGKAAPTGQTFVHVFARHRAIPIEHHHRSHRHISSTLFGLFSRRLPVFGDLPLRLLTWRACKHSRCLCSCS